MWGETSLECPFERVLLIKPCGKRGLGFASDVIPIGLEYIAAVIEDAVDDVNIIDMELEQYPLQYFIKSFQPDLVGITMSTTDHNEGLHLAKIAKENGITTVIGGYHPTSIPDQLLSHPQIDIVARGEGEYMMRELIRKGSPKDVLGLSYKEDGKIVHSRDRPLIQDLDSLPFPARHLRRHKYSNHVTIDKERERDVISMSRGCWGRCSFCCEPSMNRGLQRFRSPENVIKELLEITSFHGGKPLCIFVTDPNFLGSPKMIDRLCDLLHQHELDMVFSVLIRADSVVKNPELIKKMCENGILNYEIGIESPKIEDLKKIGKNITLEMQKKAVKILRDNGAYAGGTFVIGLPGQTEEEIETFPSYAKKIGLTGAAFGIATPFPGTGLHKSLEKDGLIVECNWTKYDEMHSVFKLENVSGERLEELATYCTAKFWTMDTLIEQVRVFQKKSGKKVQLRDFIRDVFSRLRFAWNAGSYLQPESLLTHVKVAAEASADPCVEEYTKKVGVHNVIELSWLLKAIGSQIIQITLAYEKRPVTSYIIKTTSGAIEYVKAIPGRLDNATINLDVDLDKLNLSEGGDLLELIGSYIRTKASLRRINETWDRLRLLAGLGVELTRPIIFEKLKRWKR